MNNKLFKQLAELLGYSEGYLDRCPTCVPDYMNWELLMPIAIEHGVYLCPLAWERVGKIYRAKHITMKPDFDGKLAMTNMGTKYYGDDETPQIAIVKCLIAKLESE